MGHVLEHANQRQMYPHAQQQGTPYHQQPGMNHQRDIQQQGAVYNNAHDASRNANHQAVDYSNPKQHSYVNDPSGNHGSFNDNRNVGAYGHPNQSSNHGQSYSASAGQHSGNYNADGSMSSNSNVGQQGNYNMVGYNSGSSQHGGCYPVDGNVYNGNTGQPQTNTHKNSGNNNYDDKSSLQQASDSNHNAYGRSTGHQQDTGEYNAYNRYPGQQGSGYNSNAYSGNPAATQQGSNYNNSGNAYDAAVAQKDTGGYNGGRAYNNGGNAYGSNAYGNTERPDVRQHDRYSQQQRDSSGPRNYYVP